MSVAHVEFLVEEPSMETFLRGLLPRVLGEVSFGIRGAVAQAQGLPREAPGWALVAECAADGTADDGGAGLWAGTGVGYSAAGGDYVAGGCERGSSNSGNVGAGFVAAQVVGR